MGKFITVLHLLAPFLLTDISLFSLYQLSTNTVKQKAYIYINVLLSSKLNSYETIRRKAYLILSYTNGQRVDVSYKTPKEKRDKIIELDVRRTICGTKPANAHSLIMLLELLEDVDHGHFQYYQGLNYLGNYFLEIYQGSVKNAYQVIKHIIDRYFRAYVDTELKNLRMIFFLVNKAMEEKLPILYNYLRNE